jgi:hypothetical protein
MGVNILPRQRFVEEAQCLKRKGLMQSLPKSLEAGDIADVP